MTQRLKAIPTTYHGIEFRSKLEAKYAQAFDRLGIVWEYEGRGFRFDDGTCYCPDFYMPELDVFFEVKGVLDNTSINKLVNLANERQTVIVGKPDGSMMLYALPDESRDYNGIDGGFVLLEKCRKCGKWYFGTMLVQDERRCQCGGCFFVTDGDSSDLIDKYTNNNVFKAAGWECGW